MPRKKIEVDLEQLKRLGNIGCTHDEAAGVLGMSIRTFQRRLEEDEDFAEAWSRAQQEGKATLRRWQWQAAKEGNATMLIWLGKQVLGQKQHPVQVELTGAGGGPISLESRLQIEEGLISEMKRFGEARKERPVNENAAPPKPLPDKKAKG